MRTALPRAYAEGALGSRTREAFAVHVSGSDPYGEFSVGRGERPLAAERSC